LALFISLTRQDFLSAAVRERGWAAGIIDAFDFPS
jgi:hypothetical protein